VAETAQVELPDTTGAFSRVGARRHARRVPVIRQHSVAECGAACLAMVLGYWGRHTALEDVRDRMGVARDGVTATTLVETARGYGLRARGAKVDHEELPLVPEGSILHWEFSHFVVFERVSGDHVYVVDPAVGRRRLSTEQVRRSFTGVALLFEPSDSFVPARAGQRPVWRHLRRAFVETGYWPRIAVTSILLQLAALSSPFLMGAVVDGVVARADAHLLGVLAAGYVVFAAFHLLTSFVRSHLLLQARTQLHVQMTVGFVEHLVSLPFAFFQRRSVGDLLMRLNSNAQIREVLTGGMLSVVLDGTLVFAYLALLFVASPTMALVALGLGAFQIVVFASAQSRQQELMAESLHAQSRSEAYQLEMIAGMESLKAMGAEPRAIERWTSLFVDAVNVTIERGRLSAIVDSILAGARLAGPVVVLLVGAHLVLGGSVSLGTMLALSALAAGFLGPLSSLIGTAEQFMLLATQTARLDDVFRAAPEQADVAAPQRAPRLTGAVRLEHVSFRYAPSSPPVVHDVSVDIRAGQFVAIVGTSGSGKTTLAGLLLALHRPESGRILYDGRDLALLEARSVRQQLGVVLQRPFMFGAPVRHNITMGDPKLTLDDVMTAARLAQVDEDIAAMPMGYETPLSDGGSSVSGGQRQRIALARALVRKPSILLLDEATSALDAVTEARVDAALRSLRCTRIVIAHRLSTVVDADLILMMKDGRVIERGTHGELLARRGAYYELVSAQLGEAPRPPRIAALRAT
jgi:ABC-type bacteriocin/lantibiotic exporter with double-glycine peptidase domain